MQDNWETLLVKSSNTAVGCILRQLTE